MTNKELEKRIEEQKDRQDSLDKLYQKMHKNLIDLCRSIDKLKCDVEKLKHEHENTETSKQNHDFKVGDRVQFKSWEEMEKEFGLNDDGNICISPCFAHHMKHLCGTYATILRIVGRSVTLKDFSASGKTDWCYIVDMLKPAKDEPKFKVGDKMRVKDKASLLYSQTVTILQLPEEKCEKYTVKNEFGTLDFFREGQLEPYTEPRWTFTEDEKVILRNLPKECKWIARDADNELGVFTDKPKKCEIDWNEGYAEGYIYLFKHIFQSIKWEDEEACEFRKFI